MEVRLDVVVHGGEYMDMGISSSLRPAMSCDINCIEQCPQHQQFYVKE